MMYYNMYSVNDIIGYIGIKKVSIIRSIKKLKIQLPSDCFERRINKDEFEAIIKSFNYSIHENSIKKNGANKWQSKRKSKKVLW